MKLLPTFALLLGLCPAINAQIAENVQLKTILKNASVDSIQKTERLAAILFHDKINAHRVSNGKEKLGWDDTLWLTARNHNIWMTLNDDLDHFEKAGTKSYTGTSPGDRYDFASKGKGGCSWSGENILYNYAAGYATLAENAEHMAEYAFNQWKNSPGHNDNMLKDRSRVHGVAFFIEPGGQVWATDIFAGKPTYSPIAAKPASIPGFKFSEASPVLAAASPVGKPTIEASTPAPSTTVATTTATPAKSKDTRFVSASAKYVKLDLEETNSGLQSALYTSAGIKKSRPLSKAAQHHAEYMAANQKLVHDEKKQKRKYYAGSPHQRIVKASRGAKLFHKRSSEFVESIAMIQADAATLDINALSKTILAALDKEKNVTGGTTTAVGFGTVIKRIRNELRIYVVREEKSSR
ncbi:MAG: CAP domain-containing protein [Bacteroidota bacterium]|nr:CAP domain-containing protein [Bacteroidota bacterium]